MKEKPRKARSPSLRKKPVNLTHPSLGKSLDATSCLVSGLQYLKELVVFSSATECGKADAAANKAQYIYTYN
jgi:hypothetical protein